MKKYLILTILSLVVGYVLAKLIFIEYESDAVIKFGDNYYFLMVGSYDNYDDMITNSSKIGSYIYIFEDKLYKVFTCISKDDENISKANEYYNGTILKYTLSDPELKNIIEENDLDFKDIKGACLKSIKKYKEG